MKTREQILSDISDLQCEISTAGSRKLFPPTLCLNLAMALGEFQSIAQELSTDPSNEVILEMVKNKINNGHLKESQVVDALIENTRAKREEDK